MNTSTWLIGAGYMAREYVKVLKDLGDEFLVVGRGAESSSQCHLDTGVRPREGGLDCLLDKAPAPERAVVAVGVQDLARVASCLLDAGVKRLLLEKPGGVDSVEIAALADKADATGAEVLLAYNRRFYASTRRAREIVAEDGGVRSFCFEFTEWSHVVQAGPQPDEVKARWFLANSSHVSDLAFFLGGDPAEMTCRVAGSLPWHPCGSVFAGSGMSKSGALFSYLADWDGPGRWGLEVLTAKRRLYLRPMEKLSVQMKGSVAVEPEAIDDALDLAFKPGLHRQVSAFLAGDASNFRTLGSQRKLLAVYDAMAGYATDAKANV